MQLITLRSKGKSWRLRDPFTGGNRPIIEPREWKDCLGPEKRLNVQISFLFWSFGERKVTAWAWKVHLAVGSDWEGGCCLGLGSGPTDCPLPEGIGAGILPRSWCGLASAGVPPVWGAGRGAPLTSQQLMSQTPQRSGGPKGRVTLTLAVIETDRRVVLQHNAWPPPLPSPPCTSSRAFCLLVSWAWRLSHSRQTVSVKSKLRPPG